MQQRRGDKPVVYLDQNWISNITKSYMHDWNSSEKASYQGLSSAIQEGVASGRFVCPTSSFHESEASYGSIVKNSLLYVASELSRGLHFNSPIHINHQQLLRAASEFAEQDVPDYPWWTVPFNRDPDCRLDASPEKTIQVHLSIDEFATEAKRIRDGAQITQYQAFKKERRQRNLGFEAEVDWGRKQLFEEGCLGLMVAVSLPEVAESPFGPIYRQVAFESISRCMQLAEICNLGDGLGKFLNSPEFVESPFLSIYAKLRAADIVRFPGGIPGPSILDDYHIIASVLPYTSAFATENYMAELIRQTGLDVEFDCLVFRMSEKQDFLQYLEGLK